MAIKIPTRLEQYLSSRNYAQKLGAMLVLSIALIAAWVAVLICSLVGIFKLADFYTDYPWIITLTVVWTTLTVTVNDTRYRLMQNDKQYLIWSRFCGLVGLISFVVL